MSARGFWREVVGAALISAAGAALFWMLAPLLGAGAAARLLIVAAGAAYVATLLAQSDVRVGRFATLGAWAIATLALVVLDPRIAIWIVAQAAVIWLVRSLYRYESLLSALLDGALGALAVAAALGAFLRTRSVAIALWCFFLVQALHAFIPRTPARPESAPNENDAFDLARRNADAALRRLATRG